MDATPVATHLRRSIPQHDAYTVRVVNRRVAALATAHPGAARRWIYTTKWLHYPLLCSGRLVVGLGVQWTPVPGRRDGQRTPPPATLQLCVGHRCLVFHLAQVDPDAVPAALYRFLADLRVVFVGYGSSYDRQMLWDHYGLHIENGRDLRALPDMGNASVELMAQRFLGYRGIRKPMNVSMSAWHAPRLSLEQVEYACVDAYLAFRLGVILCSGAHQPVQRAPAPLRAPPPAPVIVHAPAREPVHQPHRAPGRSPVLPRAQPPTLPAQVIVHAAPRGPVNRPHRAPGRAPVFVYVPRRAPVLDLHRAPGPSVVFPRASPPAPRAPVRPCTPPPAPRALEPHHAVAQTAVAVDGAESSNKIAETRLGFTGSSDTETERGGLSLVRSNYASPGFTGLALDTETERGGLTLVRSNYVSDDDDDDLSSDDFNLLAREAGTGDDEEEDSLYDYVARTGLLSDGDYVVGPGDHSDDDEEDAYVVGTGALVAEDVGEQGYAYEEYARVGILTVVEDDIEEGEYTGILTVEDYIEEGEYTGILTVEDDIEEGEFVSNGPVTVAFEEEGGVQLDGHNAPPEHLGEADYCGDNTGVFQGGEDGYVTDDDGGDWYNQVDDVYVQDDDDSYEPYNEFY